MRRMMKMKSLKKSYNPHWSKFVLKNKNDYWSQRLAESCYIAAARCRINFYLCLRSSECPL